MKAYREGCGLDGTCLKKRLLVTVPLAEPILS
jgi:hypothetical protein